MNEPFSQHKGIRRRHLETRIEDLTSDVKWLEDSRVRVLSGLREAPPQKNLDLYQGIIDSVQDAIGRKQAEYNNLAPDNG